MISEKLKNTFGKNAGATALLLGALSTPFALSSPAHAEDAKAQQVAMQQQEIVVPMRDSRGIGEDAIQAGAAAASKNAQVIVFFGDNYEAYKATVQAAKEIIAEGQVPLRGIILADPLEAKVVNGYQISTAQEIEIYADGQKTSTIQNPSKDVGSLIKEQLRDDYQQLIVPRRSVAAVSPNLTAR